MPYASVAMASKKGAFPAAPMRTGTANVDDDETGANPDTQSTA